MVGQKHDLGNFLSPAPLLDKDIGAPEQIAYYSIFQGDHDNEYEYQSSDALGSYKRPASPLELTPEGLTTFQLMRDYVDDLPQQGLEQGPTPRRAWAMRTSSREEV